MKKYQRAIVAFFLYALLSAFLSLPNAGHFIMLFGIVQTIFIFVVPDNFFKDDDINKIFFLKSASGSESINRDLVYALETIDRLKSELSVKTNELNKQNNLTNILSDKLRLANKDVNIERERVNLLKQRLLEVEAKNKKLLALIKQKSIN